jgi:cytochrome c oxidase cbb3-type subunit 3
MNSSNSNDNLYAIDNIQTLNHPIPSWWKTIFISIAVFGVLYAMYFHTGAAEKRSIYAGYDDAIAANLRLQFSELPGDLKPDNATMMQYVNDKKWLKVGESVFKQHCVSCHGPEGGGVVGPNLCDVYWKNVKSIEDIGKILQNGAGNGSMPKWDKLHPNELVLVGCYVASLRGSSPAKAKGPEGNEIPAWSLAAPAENAAVDAKPNDAKTSAEAPAK